MYLLETLPSVNAVIRTRPAVYELQFPALVAELMESAAEVRRRFP